MSCVFSAKPAGGKPPATVSTEVRKVWPLGAQWCTRSLPVTTVILRITTHYRFGGDGCDVIRGPRIGVTVCYINWFSAVAPQKGKEMPAGMQNQVLAMNILAAPSLLPLIAVSGNMRSLKA